MNDQGQYPLPSGSDVALERAFGTREALLAIWNPRGRPVTVSWEDSSIITANDQTRSRLTRVHTVIHAVLRGEYAGAGERLTRMSGLMRAFTALRSVTLASELLWTSPVRSWEGVLADAEQRSAVIVTNDGGARDAADTFAEAIRLNLETDRRQRILDCVADIAAENSPEARVGLGGFGAAVFSAALRATSLGTDDELVEEHAALIVALARGRTVTIRDGRLLVDG